MNTGLVVLGLIVVIAIVVGGYYVASSGILGAKNGQTSQSTTTILSTASSAPTSTIKQNTSNSQKTDIFNVTEKEYSITPNTMTVNAGDKVVLQVKNIGTVSHTFTISNPSGSGYLVDTGYLSPGQNATVSFTAPAMGNYTYYCRVTGHSDLGMRGTLIVLATSSSTATTSSPTTSQSSTAATSSVVSTSTRSTAPTTTVGGGGWG